MHFGKLCGQQACLHGLVSLLGVDVATLILQYHVGQHGNARFAHHAVGFVACQVPHGQFAMLAEDGHHRFGIVRHAVGHDDSSQRMCCTISVPQAPCGKRLIFCPAMYLQVSAHIVARDVAPGLWCHHEVVHGSIEDASLALGAEGGLYA